MFNFVLAVYFTLGIEPNAFRQRFIGVSREWPGQRSA